MSEPVSTPTPPRDDIAPPIATPPPAGLPPENLTPYDARLIHAGGPERRGRSRMWQALAPYLLLLAGCGLVVLYVLPLFSRSDVRVRDRIGLLLLLIVPLSAWIMLGLRKRRSPTLAYTRMRDLHRASHGAMSYLFDLPSVLRIVALTLLALALARPQRLSSDASEIEGIDIVIALDVSNSMAEKDLPPDRLASAKRVIDDFIRRRGSDRIGLVIFGKEAFTQCPLTLDDSAILNLLKDVRLGLIDGQGTAIGNALGTAINRLRKSESKSKVIVLVTDGDDNASKIDPRKAAQYAQTFGIRVFTILIGRDVDQAQVGTDRFGNLIAPQQRFPVNPKLLEDIASTTGGLPYLATDTDALQKRFQSIWKISIARASKRSSRTSKKCIRCSCGPR